MLFEEKTHNNRHFSVSSQPKGSIKTQFWHVLTMKRLIIIPYMTHHAGAIGYLHMWLLLLIGMGGAPSIQAQEAPKHEVRAAWVTAVYGLDWPRTRAVTPSSILKQKEELIEILDRLQAAHFNTVLFQTRTRGDVIYDSQIEPYNAILTGKMGVSPGYDPLTFAVEECHKRGMECHAWVVTIPLGNRKHVASLGAKSVVKRKPALCVPYKREYFLNPGHPDTKHYLRTIVEEIVSRYDVDGVHFDYLRYPERAGNRFADQREFRRYGNGRSLDQWRRDNLSELVRTLYGAVKALKPWVKVSSSPVGKYNDTPRYSSRGWNAFQTVYQDVQGWLGEGIQDQIYPMLYFRGNNFYPFALDWQEQSCGRHVVPGLGIYFLDPREGNWSLSDIKRQMQFCRTHGLAGEAHYRVKYLMDNTQGLYDLLATNDYRYPALQPPMPWLDNQAPSTPDSLRVEPIAPGYLQLTWSPSTDNDLRNAPRYVVYGSTTTPVDTSQSRHIIAASVTDTTFVYAPLHPLEAFTHFAVSAIDRYGNESAPRNVSLKGGIEALYRPKE